jgi:hypothetical protein
MNLDPIAKALIIAGGVLILAGVAWQMGWLQSLRIGRLPGDIAIKRDGFQAYFPITTCLLASGLLMLISWLFHR